MEETSLSLSAPLLLLSMSRRRGESSHRAISVETFSLKQTIAISVRAQAKVRPRKIRVEHGSRIADDFGTSLIIGIGLLRTTRHLGPRIGGISAAGARDLAMVV